MARYCVILLLLLGAAQAGNRSEKLKWMFAGENAGIVFYLAVSNECRAAGGKVAIKLESKLAYPVDVSFRLNDPDWSKSFTASLKAGATNSGLRYAPDGGTACHPYIDMVYVEPHDKQVTRSEGEKSEE